jgi:hypothetical protein
VKSLAGLERDDLRRRRRRGPEERPVKSKKSVRNGPNVTERPRIWTVGDVFPSGIPATIDDHVAKDR